MWKKADPIEALQNTLEQYHTHNICLAIVKYFKVDEF
jgi:hypothetical protein